MPVPAPVPEIVRSLDLTERAILPVIGTSLGTTLVGGKRKKTQDIIDMKRRNNKKLKGGQTDPAAYTYNPTHLTNPTRAYTDAQIVDAYDLCESTHYSTPQQDTVFGGPLIANTNTRPRTQQLANCIAQTLTGDSSKTVTLTPALIATLNALTPANRMCTDSQGNRVLCSSIPNYSTTGQAAFDTYFGAAARAALDLYSTRNPGAYTQHGSSLSKRSRSVAAALKNKGSSRMPRKSSCRSTTRRSTRKGSRRASRRSTRRNRK